jgi:Phage integrase family
LPDLACGLSHPSSNECVWSNGKTETETGNGKAKVHGTCRSSKATRSLGEAHSAASDASRRLWRVFVKARGLDWFVTITFRDILPRDLAIARIEEWLADIQAGVGGKQIGWILAEEFGRIGGRYHCHMLVTGVGRERRKFWWSEAFRRFGRSEIRPFDRVSDVDVEKLAVEVSKAIWNGSEDNPKTDAAFRSICISARLGSQVKEYLADRVDGYLFQTSSGNPWDASNVLERKLNTLLERLEIPKIDIKLLAKFVGRDRTIEQATRSEKRVASLGLHSFRHTVATAMDSLGIPQQIRRQRLGHSGNSVTDNYTHTFTEDERNAAEKLGELFGTDAGKVISFPNLSQKEEGLAGGVQQALVNQ